jgi:hypothetical protein
LAELTKPTEVHAKELEDQITASSRSKLSAGTFYYDYDCYFYFYNVAT